MSTLSSSGVTPLLNRKPPSNFASLSSSTSVFFSYNVPNRAGLGLYLDRPKKRGLSCNCMFGLGVPELVVIVGVTALVFGPKKLPEVGRSIGKTIKSFQQAAKEFESELKKDEEPSADVSSNKTMAASEEEKKQEEKVPTTNGTS